MNNVMTIGGYQAVIAFDPEIQMLRGEFLGLNGGADFYAGDVDGLRCEGETSLRCISGSVRAAWPSSAQTLLGQVCAKN